MIVKKVPARPSHRNAGVERARHAKHLIDYLQLPEKDNPYRDHLVAYMTREKQGADMSTERLLHIGSRGFVSKTLAGQRLEMMATAQAAVRSPNPIDHWLLSWRENEFPTPEQVDQTVKMFVGHLGVADNQVIYALHGDTHNRHLHLALNRYDAHTGRVVEINDGFNLEAAHQAVALIVDHFGWQAEGDARYVVADGELAYSESAKRRIAGGEQTIKPAAAAFEVRTGYKSVQRLAQEVALPIIREAGTWTDLHQRLAEQGIVYEARGSGAVIKVGEEAVKASAAHRKVTIAALSKRLGPFVERDKQVAIIPRVAERDRLPGAFRAEEYRAQRLAWDRWRAQQMAARDARKARAGRGLQPKIEAPGEMAAPRAEVGTPKPPRPAPDLESFYYDEHEAWFAQQWRQRSLKAKRQILWGRVRDGSAPRRPVEGYIPQRCLDGIRYARPGEGTAFIDRGNRIEVTSHHDDAALAALRLAVTRFDAVQVRGSEAFKQRVFALAIEHGYADSIKNPEFTPPAPKSGILAQAESMGKTHLTPGGAGLTHGPVLVPQVGRLKHAASATATEGRSISESAAKRDLPVMRKGNKGPSPQLHQEKSPHVVDTQHAPKVESGVPPLPKANTRNADDLQAELSPRAPTFHRQNGDPRDDHERRDASSGAEKVDHHAAEDDAALLAAFRQRNAHGR